MADKRRRRRRSMGRYIRGPIDETMALGTLAAADLVRDEWDNVVGDTTLVSSVVATWTLGQLLAPQGPILFGIAHSDYTDAEIEAWVEQVNGWNIGGLIEQEVSRRKIRTIGTFVGRQSNAGPADTTINEGKPVKTKLNWVLEDGQTIAMWAYNLSASALSGNDPQMRAVGHANLWAK